MRFIGRPGYENSELLCHFVAVNMCWMFLELLS